MPERGGRYYAVRTDAKTYLTQAIQELRITQLSSGNRCSQTAKCSPEERVWTSAVAYHSSAQSEDIGAFLLQRLLSWKKEGEKPQPDVLFQDSVLRPLAL
jgi:hypothetical protein